MRTGTPHSQTVQSHKARGAQHGRSTRCCHCSTTLSRSLPQPLAGATTAANGHGNVIQKTLHVYEQCLIAVSLQPMHVTL